MYPEHSTMQNPPRPYRNTCPECGDLSGVPWSVVTAGGGAITINLRCQCGHVWSVTGITDLSAALDGRHATTRDDVIELKRKPDRRTDR